MAILWQELLAEWRRRLQACRESLRDGDDRTAAATILRIRERILCYLLRRYSLEAQDEAQRSDRSEIPQPRHESPCIDADYFYRPPLPDVQPSDAFPPRRGRELGHRIADIHQQVQNSNRQRWWWWFW